MPSLSESAPSSSMFPEEALLTFFSMQCWVCVMPALCNWKSFFLFHKSTGTFWKIQNILHIENLSSRSGSGWQRYTVVLYYLGPADTVDRWWLSTNKHYVPSINVFFLVHLVQSVEEILHKRIVHINGSVYVNNIYTLNWHLTRKSVYAESPLP